MTINGDEALGLAEACLTYRQQLIGFIRARCRAHADGSEVEDLLHEL